MKITKSKEKIIVKKQTHILLYYEPYQQEKAQA